MAATTALLTTLFGSAWHTNSAAILAALGAVTGTGNPNGTVVPNNVLALYQDTATGNVYIATGTTNTTWVLITGGGGGSGSGNVKNTAITTVGAGTLTAAAIAGGIISRSGSTAAFTDTSDTAAAIIAAMTNESVNSSFVLEIRNTTDFAETLAAGTNVTLTGNTIVPANSIGYYLVTITSATAVSMVGIGVSPLTMQPPIVNTNIATVGAGTLTGAALAGGVITRQGSTAAYSDATDTGANIIAALPNAVVGQAWYVEIKNTVAFAETITAGDGNVTLSGQTIIPPNSVGLFLLSVATATTVTMRGLGMIPMTTPPLEANTAISTAGAGTLTGAAIAGGVITRTGPTAAFTDTTDTGANIIAAIPNAQVGQAIELSIVNTTAFAQTFAAGDGNVTLSGLAGPAPANSTTRWLVKVATATTVTMQCIGMFINAAGGTVPSITFGAGTATVAPAMFTAGTNLTAAVAGALEYDGNAFYMTAAASSRQQVDAEQYTIANANSATYNNTGLDTASAAPVFTSTMGGSANGAVTLVAGKTYAFEAQYMLTNTGTTSHTWAVLFGGTASFSTGTSFEASGLSGTTANGTATGGQTGFFTGTDLTNGGTGVVISAASTSATEQLVVTVTGIIVVNSAGTLIPQLKASARPGASGTPGVVVKAGTFFRIWEMGGTGTVGNWS